MTMSLDAYLARSHGRLQSLGEVLPPMHIVIGNEAADPDSCVCAIAMAAALDASLADTDALVAPLVLVPRADFKLQLDRVHLLRRAGLVGAGDGPLWTPKHVSFGDEIDLAALAARAPSLSLHLVDHNKLSANLAALGPHVASIVDHHVEEGLYKETASGEARRVELGIGSCASLVAERLEGLAPALLADHRVSTLLLGAILLDTVNLNPDAKAQKAREAAVADSLLARCAPSLGLAGAPGDARAAFFDELLAVKADQSLLLAFPTADLLRQDYKEEVMPLSSPPAGAAAHPAAPRVGVGSIVLPLPELLARQPPAELAAECAAYAHEKSLDVLILMSVDMGRKQRYLLLHCPEPALRARVLEAMDVGDVQLAPLDATADAEAAGAPCFAMNNFKMSRKVLLPVLRMM